MQEYAIGNKTPAGGGFLIRNVKGKKQQYSSKQDVHTVAGGNSENVLPVSLMAHLSHAVLFVTFPVLFSCFFLFTFYHLSGTDDKRSSSNSWRYRSTLSRGDIGFGIGDKHAFELESYTNLYSPLEDMMASLQK